jgi:hypothetical protein
VQINRAVQFHLPFPPSTLKFDRSNLRPTRETG